MKKYISLALILFLASCIDPINLKIDGGAGTLVVDGWITDQPGPYTVKLTRTISYDNSKPLKVYSVPEKSAKVTLVDNVGNSELLIETLTAGSYRTNTTLGVAGRSYQILIETSNASKYHSTFEELRAAPPVDALESEFVVTQTLVKTTNGSSRIQKLEQFAIYAVTTDPASTDNFYRWQVDGIFEFFSVNDNPAIKQCWAPQTRLESKLVIADDTYTKGKQFRQYLANVLYNRPTYYLVKVRQQAMGEQAFNFLHRLSIQQTSTGTLFDPPPTPIAGNMVCDTDPEEITLGYFGATGIALKELLINRFKEGKFVMPSTYLPAKAGDCRTQEPNATTVKPPGFPP